MNPIWLFLLHISAYLAIGLWLSVKIAQAHFIPKYFIVTAAFGFVAVLYYLLFFVTLADPSWGKSLNQGVCVVGWGLALFGLYRLRRLPQQRVTAIFILLPLSIMVLLAAYYVTFVSSCRLSILNSNPDDNSTYCAVHMLPGDNELPYDYARNVIHGQPHALISDWNLADRPPIQIGAGMSVLDFDNSPDDSYRAYQLISIFLQLSWVPAVFGVLICLGLKLRQVLLAIGMMSMSGFIFINSIFVWPKFFAAGLVVMGGVLLLNTSGKYYKRGLAPAIIALALGLLIHDGIIFTVLGVGLVLLYIFFRDRLLRSPRRKPTPLPWRPLLLGCLVAFTLLAPWFIYKAHNTSSDRLVKWHLAGVIMPDQRSTIQTIIDSYKNTTPHVWYENRIENIKTLVLPMEDSQVATGVSDFSLSGTGIKQSLNHLAIWYEQNDFYTTLFALGVFNLGWLVVFSKKSRSRISSLEKRLLATAAIATLVWVLVMFMPHSTVLHQGSYATVLVVFSLLATWLARSKLLLPLFIIQFFLFCTFWVFGVFARYNISLHQALPIFWLSLVVALIFLTLAKLAPQFPSNSKS